MPRKKKPTGPSKPRASDAKIELRVQAILQLKLDGAEPWNILQYVSEKEQADAEPWKMGASRKPLCERQVRRYMALADERLVEACMTQAKNALHLHLSQRRGLYARAMEDGDYRTALAVLQDLAQLADLYPAPKRQEIELNTTATLEIVEELVEMPVSPSEGAADAPA